MKALKLNQNYIINKLIVDPSGNVLKEINEKQLSHLEKVCEEVELPQNFNMEQINRYKTFSALWSDEIQTINDAKEKVIQLIRKKGLSSTQ